MLWPSRKKITARKMANRNSLVPNEGGFRLAESVGFNELAINLILTTSGLCVLAATAQLPHRLFDFRNPVRAFKHFARLRAVRRSYDPVALH